MCVVRVGLRVGWGLCVRVRVGRVTARHKALHVDAFRVASLAVTSVAARIGRIQINCMKIHGLTRGARPIFR